MKRHLFLVCLSLLIIVNIFAQEDLDLTNGDESHLNKPMVQITDLKRIQKVMDEAGPQDNTLKVEYELFSTYKIRCRTYMDTYIYLPEGEVISYAKFGEEANFTFTPILDENDVKTNMGVIQVKYAGADTNLTIIGESGNIYNFYVRVDDHTSPEVPHNLVVVSDNKFVEKIRLVAGKNGTTNKDSGPGREKTENNKGEGEKIVRSETVSDKEIGDYLKKIDNMPMNMLYTSQNLDFRYIIYKQENLIAPMAIFDDGYWTYFKLSESENLNRLKDFPVLFEVVDGIEQPVNTRTIRNYIIAENLSDSWALRVGERYICVRKNELDRAKFP